MIPIGTIIAAFIAVAAILVLATFASFRAGIKRGRDEQYNDDFIAAGRKDRERRNRLGQFKSCRH